MQFKKDDFAKLLQSYHTSDDSNFIDELIYVIIKFFASKVAKLNLTKEEELITAYLEYARQEHSEESFETNMSETTAEQFDKLKEICQLIEACYENPTTLLEADERPAKITIALELFINLMEDITGSREVAFEIKTSISKFLEAYPITRERSEAKILPINFSAKK